MNRLENDKTDARSRGIVADRKHGTIEAYIGMARAFQNAWFAFSRTFVIPKTNDNYSRRVLEKLMDCVEILVRFFSNWKFRYDRRKGARTD